MRIEYLKVENFKGLLETEIPVSDFVCIVGENNAGKSSLLQAILLFLNGPKIPKSVYYCSTKDILIKARIGGVTASVLDKVVEEHRARIAELVHDESITLARRYDTDGIGKLRVVKDVPSEAKYSDENITDALKGKRAAAVGKAMKAFYPEVADDETLKALSTQTEAKELIKRHILALPPDRLVERDVALPTGIDNSFKAILPEPIYIPAVKDLTDELKTKESASFGKLLNILLNVIEDDLLDAKETFEELRRKLNRITDDEGIVSDDRMDKVRDIENTIQTNLNDTFRDVQIELEIPPPEIKSVLSNANIVANDGVRGPIDNKGDGFKRAITFSILRTYVQLSQNSEWRKPSDAHKATKDRFLFLFEEPELYLHPRAQNILFDALALISENHQVLVTTHSPLFFSPSNTTTFVKMVKTPQEPAPIGQCLPVSLEDISERDKFQIISFESCNVAFFSNRIVLIEGDSEAIVLPHISLLLNEKWDLKSQNIDLVRVSGKGSFKRYREFFDRFNVPVLLFADLDVLIRDFDKLAPSPAAVTLRDELLVMIDKIIDKENNLEAPKPRLLKEELQKERARKLFEEIKDARTAGETEKMVTLLDELFIFERSEPRMVVLKDHTYTVVVAKKRELLAELRCNGVFVLERGAIEEYYPPGVEGADKPTRAQSFCRIVTDKDQVSALSDKISAAGGKPELELLFDMVFEGIET